MSPVLTRRELLVGGAVTAAALALPACGTNPNPASGRIPGTYAPDALLPGGGIVHGTNLVLSPQNYADAVANDNGWSAQAWADFDLGWFTDEIELAASLGCNTVRIFGSMYGLYTSQYTRSEYYGMWDQLAAAVTAAGMYLYPTGQSPWHDRLTSIPVSFLLTEMPLWAAHLHTYQRCIGVDLVQESFGWASDPDKGRALYQAVKAVTDLPCTFSNYWTNQSAAEIAAQFPYLADRTDFFDVHFYRTDSATVFDTHWQTWDRPLLFGEYGGQLALGQSTQVARYTAVKNLAEHISPNGHRIAGGLAFSLKDYTTTSGAGDGQYGLHDVNDVERPWIADVFRQTIGAIP